MPLKITLEFDTIAEAQLALSRLSGTIAPEDRPDVGRLPLALTPAPQTPEAALAAAVFGGAGVPAHPPAPSTAAAAASPTAPAAPTPGLPQPPSAGTPTVPSHVGTAAAPTAPAATPNPAGVELDVSGLPWDGRIHSSTKAKNKDGTWRALRGRNDEAKAKAIEAELRAAMAAGAPPAPPQPPAPPVTPPAPPIPPATPPAPPAAAGAPTFATLMVKITTAKTAGKLAPEAVDAALAQVGLTTMMQLAPRPDLVATVNDSIDACLAA